MVTHGRRMDYIGLNPFEVREVLQVSTSSTPSNAKRLNPFEVREVLQDFKQGEDWENVSQSL